MRYFLRNIIGVAAVLLAIAPSCDKINRNREAFLDVAGEENAAGTSAPVKVDRKGVPLHSERPVIPDSISSQVKEYTGYTLSFNKSNGTPNWSAWELLAEETDGEESRSSKKFWRDEGIAGCLDTKDYTNSGYDRGHLCPAADMKWSADAMHDCFSMANIAPQDHSLNSGAWGTLEKKCRQWAQRDGGLLICAGPIYDKGDKTTIGDGKARVPSAFFKVIVAPYIDRPRGIAFVYPNMSAPGNMVNYAMSIDEAERLTGFDFFPALPDGMERAVESVFSFKDWERR